MKRAIYGLEPTIDVLISVDGIGITYMKLNDTDKALRYQRKALEEW
jgi:hypothetical protein